MAAIKFLCTPHAIILFVILGFGIVPSSQKKRDVAENPDASTLDDDDTADIELEDLGDIKEEASDWPPKNVSLSDSPKLWPGHALKLGEKVPQKKVEIWKKGFPNPTLFYDDYVAASTPALFPKAASTWPARDIWTDINLKKLPYPATTYIYGKHGRKEQRVWASGETLSLRKFLKVYRENNIYMDYPVPHFMTTDVMIPDCLLCDPFLSLLDNITMWMQGRDSVGDLATDNWDKIHCQIFGKQNFLLIPAKYKNSIKLDRDKGDWSAVDVTHVDFEEYPDLRKLNEIYPVQVNAGDCIFIPAKWFFQSTLSGKNVGVTYRWQHKRLTINEKACGNATKLRKPVQANQARTTEFLRGMSEFLKNGMIHAFFKYVERHNSYDKEEFIKKLKQDKEFLKGMTEWTDELEEHSHELFDWLDIDKDGKFSQLDFDEIREDTISNFRQILDDRVADFEDVIRDQEFEQKSAKLGRGGTINEELTRQLMDNYTKQLEKFVEDSMNKVLAGQNKTGSGKTKQEFTEPEDYYESREDARAKLKKKQTPKPAAGDDTVKETIHVSAGDTGDVEEIVAEDEEDVAQKVPASVKKETTPKTVETKNVKSEL